MAERSPASRALGRAVRQLRDQRDVSQDDLAAIIGIHRTYLGGIERGERNPTYANIRRVAEGLGVPGSELLALAEKLERSARGRRP